MQPVRLTQPLVLTRGATFRQSFFLQQPVLSFKDVTGGNAFPLELTVPAHGLYDGWPIWVEGVPGIPELNRPYGGQPLYAEVVDPDTLRFSHASTVNRPRPNSGKILYNLPVDLNGASASLELLGDAEPTETFVTTTIEGPGLLSVAIASSATADIPWERAQFALWLTMSNGDRDCWLTGQILAQGVAP